MKVQYSKKFLKQLSKIPLPLKSRIEQFSFIELPTISQVELSGRIEKMKGYDGFYKARFGNYRLGMHKIGNTLIVKIVMHRKDIYNYFP